MKKINFLVVTALFASGVFAQTKGVLQIKGSDTMVNTVQELAEKYMLKNKGKKISVTGGGSGTGIAALINGTCDIANSSRDIKDKEKTAAKGTVNEIALAIDGLSIIVNKNNSVHELSLPQLAQIFKGEIKNWKELGGKDEKISLYGRQANSGTYDFFIEHILNKTDFSGDVKQMNGNAQIVEAVKNSKSAIGYVGSGYVKDSSNVTVLYISTVKGAKAYAPTKLNISSKKYPISRPLYQYIKGTISKDVKDFLMYELGPEGSKLMEEHGFFPISKVQKTSNNKVLGIK